MSTRYFGERIKRNEDLRLLAGQSTPRIGFPVDKLHDQSYAGES